VVGVADERDPAGDRDLLALESVGVSRSVEALVLGAHRRGEVGETVGAGHDSLAHRRVLEHELPLLSGQRAALLKDRVGDPDLSDVVEHGDLLGLEHLPAGEP